MYRTVYNPGFTPVVIDDAGHVIGGGEWGTVETTDGPAAVALANENLILTDAKSGTPGAAPAADAALAESERRAERVEQLSGMDKAALTELAVQLDLIQADEDPLRDDVHRMLVESDAALPQPSQAKAKTAKRSNEEQ